MFLIREAVLDDFAGVFPLATILDSYNLPADPGYIRQLLDISARSFAGKLPRRQAQYLFVLEEKGKIVGCSLIIAKHGTPRRPHLWLSLDTVTRRSRTLGFSRSHKVLRLGYTEDGPTEVGGLVVLPGYRRHPLLCGLQISYVRFLYMAIHPERFESRILVEFRGAMGSGKRSPFWEAIGRVFTGLPYRKADRLSVTNKEFIVTLFPREPIYCALLPKTIQEAIGAIHPAAQRAAGLLKRIGFRPLPQVEPFDGGPYYAARRSQIRLIRQTRKVAAFILRPSRDDRRKTRDDLYLVGTEKGGIFRAILTPATGKKGSFSLGEEGLRILRIGQGETVYAFPIPR